MATNRPSIIDLFVSGAKRGYNISMTAMLPNLIMAFVIIRFLDLCGFLPLVSKYAAPVMAIFGLPGDAMVVIVTAFMSIGGGCGAAAALATAGKLNIENMTQLLPCVMLLGAQLQYMGRCLGTADAKKKYWLIHCLISVCNGLIALWIMKFILLVF